MEVIKQKYPPGDFAIWIIIYIELITFGAFFIGFAFARRLDIELFNESQGQLQATFGFINTLILITSSFFVVKAVELIKQEKKQNKLFASYWLLAAIFLGFAFLSIKLFEFYTKIQEGINLSTNTFFMFYYIMTVFHFLHVVLGVFILFVLYKQAKKGAYTKDNHKGLLTGASYWHMVDLVWIVLFPLLYIMR